MEEYKIRPSVFFCAPDSGKDILKTFKNNCKTGINHDKM